MAFYEDLKLLEPFGEGNPMPVLGLRGVTFSNVQIMGTNGAHAAFAFGNPHIPRATWWNHGEQAEMLRAKSASRFDITFTVDVSTFGGGDPHLELRLCDVVPAAHWTPKR